MWNSFLESARRIGNLNNKNLLVLGKHSGKRAVIEALGESVRTFYGPKDRLRIHHSYGYHFQYLNVVDKEDSDNRHPQKVDVYIVSQIEKLQLLTHLLDQQFVVDLGVFIMLDASQPWTFIQELNYWLSSLRDLIAKAKPSLKTLEALEQQVVSYAKLFSPPSFYQNGRLIRQRLSEDAEQVLLKQNLPPGLLLTNPRIPLVVVVTKSDLVGQASKDKPSHFNYFVQYSLRKFCAENGAALAFTSSKSMTNVDCLYDYLMHRFYNFPLRVKPQVQNQEAVFVPFGFDNSASLSSAFVGIPIDREYQAEVQSPPTRKTKQEEQVQCLNIDSFAKTEPVPAQARTDTQKFYMDLLKAGPAANPAAPSAENTLVRSEKEERRKKAEQELKRKMQGMKRKP